MFHLFRVDSTSTTGGEEGLEVDSAGEGELHIHIYGYSDKESIPNNNIIKLQETLYTISN